eukprot:m.96683 g.96683  ORF g.96683 m.96683 type:complete len:314 (+) comp13080_c0_seq1:236-1177(+)
MSLNMRTLTFVGAVAVGAGLLMDWAAGLGALLAGLGGAYLTNMLFAEKKLIALNPAKAQHFRLSEKKQLSHDSYLYRFALQSPQHVLGLPVGQHMSLVATIDGKEVKRAYTPTSSDDEIGYFDLVIKVYRPCERFPNGGKMSQYVDSLAIGESIQVQGPKGLITYLGNGQFSFADAANKKPAVRKTVKQIGMIAGGTGITPMLQIIADILKHPEDKTQVSLIFGNQTEEDILCRDMIEEAAKDPRFTVYYTLDRPGPNWTQGSGFVSKDMMEEHLPAAKDDAVVLLCGPPMMVKSCRSNLDALGFAADQHYKF